MNKKRKKKFSILKSCYPIQIVTPKKYILDGLWFGGVTPKKGFIFIHGLASSTFAHHDFLTPLATGKTAAIFFSNRGHDKVTGIRKISAKSKKGYIRETAGEAHEVFTDCVDDIQGAVDFLVKKKVKNIYLVGHSTGCQKAVYFLSQKNAQKHIQGVVLLAPLSDYASIKKFTGARRLKKAQQVARDLVSRKKAHALMPWEVWDDVIDAQRFLSLYTPESKENIFSYDDKKRTPRALQKVNVPTLVVLAGADENRDRDMEEVAEWFEENIRAGKCSICVVPSALHSFNGDEKKVSEEIARWAALG